jgi:hypothetical protein
MTQCLWRELMSQRMSPSNPEFELHHQRLLLMRQAQRRFGIILVLAGFVYFLLVSIYYMPALFQHGRWVAGGIAGLSGAAICLYFARSGAASIQASLQPVSRREVCLKRREMRRQLFQLSQGELPLDYTPKGRIITLVAGSGMTMACALTLLFFLMGIPELVWARILLSIAAVLVELTLILDVFYLRAKAARDLPAQSALELALLLAAGELTAGETSPEEK